MRWEIGDTVRYMRGVSTLECIILSVHEDGTYGAVFRDGSGSEHMHLNLHAPDWSLANSVKVKEEKPKTGIQKWFNSLDNHSKE